MSKVDDARTAVSALNKLSSAPEKFVATYAKIVDAGKTLVEADRNALLTIVSNFVDNKIPDEIDFAPLDASARLFQQNLAAQIIGTGMANIAARNAELQSLLAQFGMQTAAINASANNLPQIKENIDKATKAVKTAKDLFSQITNPDASKMAKLQAVIKALEDLDGIF